MNLEFNKSYKYKELCNALNLEPKTGRTKIYQLKKIQSQYEILKNGNYFTVLREYTDQEKSIIDLKGIYQKSIEAILSDVLSKQKENLLVVSTGQLMQMCALVNQDYMYCKYNPVYASLILDTDPDVFENYLNTTYSMLGNLIKRVLEQLAKKDIIFYRKSFRIYKKENNYTTSLDIEPESKEEEKILEIEQKIIKELGCRNLRDVYANHNNILNFQLKIAIEITKIFPGYTGYCRVHRISFNPNFMDYNKKNVCKEINMHIKEKIKTNDRKELEELDEKLLNTYIEATIELSCPYNLKETIMKYKENRIDPNFFCLDSPLN